MKVAIVHDWLVTDAGAEKVLKALVEIYPEADIFSIVDFLSPSQRDEIIMGKNTTTSFIQNLPFSKTKFRHYMSFFPKAVESFDLSKYNLVISSSWAFAKGVKTHKAQLHVCYCYTPIRYAWDMFDEYTKDLPWYTKHFIRASLKKIRKWDIETLPRVDHFIADSYFVQERINRTYKREAEVIYPPVNTDQFKLHEEKKEFYVTASRLVPYKKTSLVVEAFNKTDKELIVIGEGQDYKKIKNMAKSNIKVLGYQDTDALCKYMREAKAFVYAAIEDFGIVPIEAMACGTPVLALGTGGTKETVKPDKTGLHFEEQTVESILKTIDEFEKKSFNAKEINEYAKSFSTKNFKEKIEKTISHLYQTKQL